MLFNSISYLIFLPLVLLAYWFSPQRFRRPLLLIASYVFYMSWLPVYGLLILALSIANYLLGLLIDRYRSQSKPLFVAGLVINLGTLCVFKYTNFLLSSFNHCLSALTAWLHLNVRVSLHQPLDIILPLGISFFAFEFIHYLTDVYKGDRPISKIVDFGLFAAFFPSQIAGPIKRYQDFIHQLPLIQSFNPAYFHQGLVLLLQGLFKKVALSDNLAPLATAGFAASHLAGTADAWIATMAFTLQIYFDFSGYTDMGRGSALMFGFTLPDNFNFPYLASSLSDFWKRWHISLSTWLRDYLYIPLGGGRCSAIKKCRNLLITMLLGGLWHGAAWHFVFWGGFHGLGLVANHKYDEVVQKTPALQRFHLSWAGKVTALLLTFLLVIVGWVFFRADSLIQATEILSAMFAYRPSSVLDTMLQSSPVFVALSTYLLYTLIFRLDDFHPFPVLKRFRSVFSPGIPSQTCIYAGIVLAIIGFAPPHPSPFIYFQF